jgi:hypothetical protein
MSARAYEHLCSDYPQVDAASLAALRDALAAETAPTAALSAGEPAAPSSFPLTIPLLAGLEWAVANAARQPSTPAELRGLSAEAASAAAYAEVYALGCVRRAARLVAAHASGRDVSAALRSYSPPTVGNGVLLSQAAIEAQAGVACAAPSGDSPVDEGPSAEAWAAGGVPLGASPADDGPPDEVWAAHPDDDDVPYEPLAPPATAPGGGGCLPLPRAPISCGDRAEDQPQQPVRVKLAHLVASLTFAPLSSLASPAAWSDAALGSAITEAIRAVAHASASGTLSPAAAEELAWPLLSLLRERLRSAPAALEAELPAALSAAGPSWRPRFLTSLLGDGGLLGHGAPPGAYQALEAAVCAELPALIESLQSDDQAHAPPESMSLLLALLRCFLDPPRAQAARAANALLASGAPQLLMQRRMGVGGADEGAEWRWLLSACCRHRPLLAFAARVPQLLGTIRSSAYLRERASERVAWLWLMAVERRPSSAASAAAAAQAESSAHQELDSEALVALQGVCFNACPRNCEDAAMGEAVRPGGEPAINNPSGTTAVGDAELRQHVDSLLVVLELLEILKRATAAATPPRDLFLSAAGAPLWAELEALSRRSKSELLHLRPAGGGEVAGSSPNDSAGEQKRAELLERVCRALKALQLANAAPRKGD